MATGLTKEYVNGKMISYSGKIRFNTISNLSFADRLLILLGREIVAECTLYTTSTHVNIVATDVVHTVGKPSEKGKELIEKASNIKKMGVFRDVKTEEENQEK